MTGDGASSFSYAANGTGSLNLGGGGGVADSITVDMSQCSDDIVWEYRGKRGPESPDSNDYLRLSYWTGSSWSIVDTWYGNGSTDGFFTLRSGLITGASAYNSNFRIRLSTFGSGINYDDFYVDDLHVYCDVPVDTSDTDTAALDTGDTDTAVVDSGDTDTAVVDTGDTDTAVLDTGDTDTAVVDTGDTDTAVLDTGDTDTALVDTGDTDTAALDTGDTDTAALDTGDTDTAVVDTDTGGGINPALEIKDDFEGGFDPAVWTSVTGDYANDSTYVANGTGSLKMGGGLATAQSIVVDMSQCTGDIVWSYQGKRGPERPDANDFLRLSFWNGASWSTVDTWYGNGIDDAAFSLRSGVISTSSAYNADFRVQLISDGTAGFDHFYVDDFHVYCDAVVGGTGDTSVVDTDTGVVDTDTGGSIFPALEIKDDFEGGFDPAVWTSVTGDYANDSTYVANGTGSLKMGGGIATAESIVVDMSQCSGDIVWSYQGKRGPESPDSTDLLRLSFWSGVSWVAVDTWNGNGSTDISFSLRSGVITTTSAYNADFKIQLFSDGTSTGYDHYYVDDLHVYCDVPVGDTGDTGVVDTDTGGTVGPALEIKDDFEGGYDAAVWTTVSGDASNNTTYTANGSGSLRMGGGSGTVESIAVNMASCSGKIVWEYNGKRGPETPDSGDYLRLSFWAGTTWTTVDTWYGVGVTDSSFSARGGSITTATAYNSNFRIRFQSFGSGTNTDHFFIDDLHVYCDATVDTGGPGPSLIIEDDFDGGYDSLVWTTVSGDFGVSNTYFANGTSSLRMGGGIATADSITVDMSQCSGSINWSYAGKRGPESPDYNDFLRLSYWTGSRAGCGRYVVRQWRDR